MSVLVFGYSGQVAQELVRLSDELELSFIFLGRQDADLSYPENCEEVILAREPTAVINAAAWTAVDSAETAEAEASVVNGEAPGAMARACAKLCIPFLHISTDYVFDGSGDSPWRPYDTLAPLGAYGRSKLLGEQLVQKSGARAIPPIADHQSVTQLPPPLRNLVANVATPQAREATITLADGRVFRMCPEKAAAAAQAAFPEVFSGFP